MVLPLVELGFPTILPRPLLQFSCISCVHSWLKWMIVSFSLGERLSMTWWNVYMGVSGLHFSVKMTARRLWVYHGKIPNSSDLLVVFIVQVVQHPNTIPTPGRYGRGSQASSKLANSTSVWAYRKGVRVPKNGVSYRFNMIFHRWGHPPAFTCAWPGLAHLGD